MEMKKLISSLAAAAKELGVTEYEMYYAFGSETEISGLNRELNSFSSGTSAGICLRVLKEGKMGYASSELFSEDEMYALVERALENAESTEKLDEIGLFAGSPSYEAPRMKPFAPVETQELKALTEAAMRECYSACDKTSDGTSATSLTASVTRGIVNSHGLALESSSGINAVMMEGVVKSGDETQSEYIVRCYDENTNIPSLAEEVTDAALAKIGAELVPSGKYDVIIEGAQMRAILSAFSPVFSAKNAQMGLSLLKGKEGEKIASDILTLIDDPMREGSTVGIPFDAEGVATHRKAVIEGGVLKTLLHNRETALRGGTETTANASKGSYSSPIGISPYCFYIEGGSYSKEELYRRAGNALLVTDVSGLHAGTNAVTGDFSIESSGFMIRDGVRAEAVKSFTIAGNFFELIKNIEALGGEVKFSVSSSLTYFGAPDTLVKDISVAGK